MAALALTVAFLSASQDIVIDAYRVEFLPLDLQGPGAGMIETGYRIAMLVSGAGLAGDRRARGLVCGVRDDGGAAGRVHAGVSYSVRSLR